MKRVRAKAAGANAASAKAAKLKVEMTPAEQSLEGQRVLWLPAIPSLPVVI